MKRYLFAAALLLALIAIALVLFANPFGDSSLGSLEAADETGAQGAKRNAQASPSSNSANATHDAQRSGATKTDPSTRANPSAKANQQGSANASAAPEAARVQVQVRTQAGEVWATASYNSSSLNPGNYQLTITISGRDVTTIPFTIHPGVITALSVQ